MDSSDNSMDSRVALVTGAGGGMGRHHAVMLASRGAAVIVLDRFQDAADETADMIDGKTLAVAADVTDVPALQAAIADAAKQTGPIDILVNNAGIGGQGPHRRYRRSHVRCDGRRQHERSFFATQLSCRMKEKHMARSSTSRQTCHGWGIIRVTLRRVQVGAVRFVKSWARELAPWNIAVNAVAPVSSRRI